MESERRPYAREALWYFGFTCIWSAVALLSVAGVIAEWPTAASGIILHFASAPVFLFICLLTVWTIFRPGAREQRGGGLIFIGFLLGLVGCVAAFMLPAIALIRPAANKMLNGARIATICKGLNTYDAEHGSLPPAASTNAAGEPLLSWRVLILPMLSESALYGEFRLDEPWDSSHNLKLLPRMPKAYEHPVRAYRGPGMTHYQVLVGGGAAFDSKRSLSLKALTAADGPSNTILLVDAFDAVPWTKPADIDYDPAKPLPSLHTAKGRVFVGLATAEPKHLSFPDTPERERLFRALISWNGREDLDYSVLVD